MPEDMPPGELVDLAYPYALDALSDADRRATERLLDEADERSAAEFRATVRSVRETLARMAVIDAVPAPPRVETAILQALDDQPATVEVLSEHAHRVRRLRWLAAAAAAIVAVAVGVGVAVSIGGGEETAGITAQEVLDEPDTRSRVAEASNGGTMSVFASPGLAAAAVSFDDLPSPPAGKVYQMWLIPADGQPLSAGVLDTIPTRGSPLVVRIGDASQLAVTVEPAGGSPAPTTDPVAAVSLG